ncbi:MAG: redoxin domain-containing protein [Gammaproteobacteria bacterium]|nr:redoxin domain-containing protein [Gammaproteobacteria bacterium]MYF57734.1 redoxin domain-containing protein [Gammaproteobacteria bacterium]
MAQGIMEMLTGKTIFATLIIAGGCLAAASCAPEAANDGPTSEAVAASKASYEEGQRAFRERNAADAVTHFRTAIELDPNNTQAHRMFIFASQDLGRSEISAELDEEERNAALKATADESFENLLALYEEWSRDSSDTAAYKWAIGQLYMYRDYDKVRQYTNEALALDPGLSDGYSTLALIADVSGDKELELELLEKAVEAAPDSPDKAFYYAASLHQADPALWREKSLEVAERFPESERGAQSLYWLAYRTGDRDERISIYERLRTTYPPEEFDWSGSGMTQLANLYSESQPEKALALAEQMVAATAEEPDGWSATHWNERLALQQNVMKADELIADGQFQQAVELLQDATIPRFVNANVFHETWARALDGAGQTVDAYEYLLPLAAKEPTERVRGAAFFYAEKLEKDEKTVRADIRNVLEEDAEEIMDYSFERYDNGERVSLSDFQGKVVLLNFWYPFCGPCRGENPELQKVLEKYGPEGFEILALNVHPEEDEFVLPYATGNGFDFIQLRSDMEFAQSEFQARGMPTNFLLDIEGRKVLRLPPIAGTQVRTLELQIESLLPEKSAAGGLVLDAVSPGPEQAEVEAPGHAGVIASVNPGKLTAGAQALMKIELELVPGTHANSDSPRDSALIPTTFFPDSVEGVVWEQVIYPRPTEVIEWYSVDPLPVFEDGAVIQARLSVDEDAVPGKLDVSGQLRIQVCDADYCYPPERVPVTAAITVIGQ